MLHLCLEVTRHRPVKRRGREQFRLAHAHVERHAVVGLPGLVRIVEGQRGVFQRQLGGKRLRVMGQRLGVAQVVRLHHQELRLLATPLAHEVHQFADGGNGGPGQSGRIKPERGLVEVEIPAVPRAREDHLDLFAGDRGDR